MSKTLKDYILEMIKGDLSEAPTVTCLPLTFHSSPI